MSAIDPETNVGQLSFVSYPSGEERRLTQDLTDYSFISATADGRTIVAQKRDSTSQLWIAPYDNLNQGRVLLTTSGLAYHYLSWTSDDQIYFDVEDSGIDIWKISVDGNGRECLTNRKGQNREPSVMPDGRFVFFISTRSGSSQVWRMDGDGNNPMKLTNAEAPVAEPTGVPGEDTVFYRVDVKGRWMLMRSRFDGSQPEMVTEDPVDLWAISNDGGLLAYSYHDTEANRTRVAVIALAGGSPPVRFDLEPCYLLRWTVDGKGLIFIGPDDSIWSQSIAGGTPKQLTHFQRDLQLISFALSPDGKHLAFAKNRNNWDAVTLTLK
jgi:Tol biopolymer transport system component